MANEKAMSECRLSVLLARDPARGVVLRRGPTDWVQLILWRTDTDTFEPGQWFHGRIYQNSRLKTRGFSEEDETRVALRRRISRTLSAFPPIRQNA
jgi:hypothetical protein